MKHVSLAYRELTEVHPSFAAEFGAKVQELDLSNNNIRANLESLSEFTALHTLVLDSNAIVSTTKFPRLPGLHTLSLNKNDIDNLPAFTNRLVGAFPGLRYLSMLNNPACPNFFNGGTPKQYQDYRLYLIARIPGLQALDSTQITPAERKAAQARYGDDAAQYGAGSAPELVKQSNDVKAMLQERAKRPPEKPAAAITKAVGPSAQPQPLKKKKKKKKKPVEARLSSLQGLDDRVPSVYDLDRSAVPSVIPPQPGQKRTTQVRAASDELPSLDSPLSSSLSSDLSDSSDWSEGDELDLAFRDMLPEI